MFFFWCFLFGIFAFVGVVLLMAALGSFSIGAWILIFVVVVLIGVTVADRKSVRK